MDIDAWESENEMEREIKESSRFAEARLIEIYGAILDGAGLLFLCIAAFSLIIILYRIVVYVISLIDWSRKNKKSIDDNKKAY